VRLRLHWPFRLLVGQGEPPGLAAGNAAPSNEPSLSYYSVKLSRAAVVQAVLARRALILTRRVAKRAAVKSGSLALRR
jgi:hypothetical protein